jgi:hypothetical protein
MCKLEFSKETANRFGRIFLSGIVFLLTAFSVSISVNAQRTAVKPNATFEKIWVDYNVTEGGQKGMRIHLKFNVRAMKGADAAVRIYFLTPDGKNLLDKNSNFASAAGYVALYKNLKIDYDPGFYEDLAVFMPYGELDLEGGEYDLKMVVDLIYRVSGEFIQRLTTYDFNYTQPETEPTNMAPPPNDIGDLPTSKPVFTFDKTWIDYDVFEGGKKGMRIHVKFTVKNMKGVDSYLRIRVARQNDEFLKSTSNFSTDAGELAVSKKLTPAYDLTYYNDEKLFLPYEEIKLGRGVFNLKLDVDIVSPDEEVIQHLGWHNFVYRNGVTQ